MGIQAFREKFLEELGAPRTWGPMEKEFAKNEVGTTTDEYKEIAQHFLKHCPNSTIVNVRFFHCVSISNITIVVNLFLLSIIIISNLLFTDH